MAAVTDHPAARDAALISELVQRLDAELFAIVERDELRRGYRNYDLVARLDNYRARYVQLISRAIERPATPTPPPPQRVSLNDLNNLINKRQLDAMMDDRLPLWLR